MIITKKSFPLKRYLFDTGGTMRCLLSVIHDPRLIALATPPWPSQPVGSPSESVAGTGSATTAVGLIVLMQKSYRGAQQCHRAIASDFRSNCVYSRAVISTPFQWEVHPARARPIASACAVIAVCAVSVLVARLAGDWLWGALSALGLLMSLSRFFLPTRFHVDVDGAEVTYPLSKSRLAWSEVGCIRWRARRALIARGAGARSQVRGLALDFTGISEAVEGDLRAFVQLRTAPEVWQ